MNSIREYSILSKIGEGKFATVYKAINVFTQKIYVLKIINTGDMNKDLQNMVRNEIYAMTQLSMDPKCNPYIICYYESFDINNKTVIVMDYISDYSLYDYISTNSTKLPGNEILKWMRVLSRGVAEIHHKNFAHRDIKPENIVIDPIQKTAKFIDFGFVCSTDCMSGPGSLYYVPPELFSPELLKGIEPAQAHDIWSLGVTFYLLANHDFPFKIYKTPHIVLSKKEISNNIRNGQIQKSQYYQFGSNGFESTNNIINFVIDSMLDLNWKTRPKIDDVLKMLS